MRRGLGVSLSALMVVTLLPAQAALAIPPGDDRNGPDLTDLQQEAVAPLDEVKAAELAEWAGDLTPPVEYEPTDVAVPPGGTADVPLDAAGEELVQAGDLPVSLGKASPTETNPTPPEPSGTWGVEVEPRTTVEGVGVDGALITVTPPSTEATPVDVELDYSAFEDLYGTEWASRLKLEQLPECFLTTPELPECTVPVEVPSQNDAGSDTVRATVDPAMAQASGLTTQSGGGPMVLAATDSASGAGGTYKATDLSPTGSWTAGGSGGGFSWSYPLNLPAAPAGPGPSVGFHYSSQAVDGKTSVANGQASWVGDGWNYHPGFVERRYRSCSEDRDGTPNNDNATDKKKSDLCWAGDHVVMSLGGATTELVLDDGVWTPASDSGAKVELKKDIALANGDDDGEYWVVTTRDGTRHWFGKHAVGGGRPDTNSVFTAPVFGNHAGEPCHATAFKDSSCTQAWRWNLDYVEDVHGNAMVIDWARETNHYAKNGKFKEHVSYVRGGYPKKIEYGLRAADLDGPPAARVSFSVAERCIKEGTVDCSDADFDSTNYADKQPWWDTPSTLHCKADAENCYVSSPTFWTRKRLSAVTTYAQRTPGSTALSKVDVWALEHSFPRQRTDTHPPLWLESITRTGYGPDGDSTMLPPVTFLPNVVDMPNRVARSSTDPTPDFDRLRVETIRTETGGEIQVTYSAPCAIGASPDPLTNGSRCFPVHWSPDPELETPKIEWFNKYVVTKVVQKDRVARQPDVVTTYTYEGDAAWAKDSDVFSKPELRTYNQWRGYGSVVVKQGLTQNTGDHDATVQTQTRTRYFRGMSEDAGRATVTIKDSTGVTIAEDLLPYQGMAAETLTYDQAGGTVEARTVSWPWSKLTASRTRGDGLPPQEAYRTGVERTDSIRKVSDGERTVRTVNTFDAVYDLPETSYAYTLTPDGSGGHTTGNQVCTTNTYVHNTSKHLIGLTSRQRVTTGDCAQAATATGDDVVSDTRTSYDALDAFGQTPTRGLPFQVDTVDAAGTGWITSARTTFDALGRALSVTDAEDNVTRTSFSPATGPAFSTTTTNPLGHTTTTTVDPGRGTPLTTTDTNARTTTLAYDNLGRSTAVWTPSQDPATDKAAQTFAYQIDEDAPPAITSRTLRDNGTYADSVTLLDGLLRPRQTQTEALGGGRIITDTRHNTLGSVAATDNGYLATGEPKAELFVPESVFVVPHSSETAYDGMGRPVKTTVLHAGEVDHTSVTSYGGDWTLARSGMAADGTTPRRGSRAVRTWTDALGRTTLVQHATATDLSTWNDTRYTYDARGNHTKVTDAEGNEWTYEYDARGRLTRTTDPDMGAGSFTYDALDRQVTSTNSRGQTQHTTYDVLGRKTELREDSATGTLLASWTYDSLYQAKGLPVASTRYTDGDAYTTEVTGYDVEYRPTGTRVTIPMTPDTTGLSGVYEYGQTYTPTGQPQTTTLPATPGGLPAEKVITRYNGEGMPITTSGHDWYTADATYSPFGEVLRTVSGEAPHRVWSTAEYDVHTRRLDRTITDREKAGPHRLTDTGYTYDVTGNVTSVTDATTEMLPDRQCFSYDNLGQLRHAWTALTASCPRNGTAVDAAPDPADLTLGPDSDGYWHTFTYDAIGNRTTFTDHDLTDSAYTDSHTYTYDSAQPHTLTQVNSTEKSPTGTVESLQTYAYDAAGNTTERQIGGDTQKLTWNSQNKVTGVDTTGDGTNDVTYIYDADGNRLIENTSTGATLFLGDAQITVDTFGQATEARRYYSHPGAPTTVRSTGGSANRDEHELTVLLADHHNTATTAVTLDATMAVQRRKFDPFGNPRGTEPTAWPGRDSFLGTGIDDPATGLTHIGAREYDPTLGRFISVDPLIDITDPMQMNGYAYANNNPVTYSDPSGLMLACGPQFGMGCGSGVATRGDGSLSSGGNPTGGGVISGGTSLTTHSVAQKGDVAAKPESISIAGRKIPTFEELKGTLLYRENMDYQWHVEMWARSQCFGESDEFCRTVHALGWFGNSPDVDILEEIGVRDHYDCVAAGDGGACKSALLDIGVSYATKGGSKALGALFKGLVNGFKRGKSFPVECLVGRHSFVEGTSVLLANGESKPIEEIEIGDKVLAADPQTGETTSKTVTSEIFTKNDKRFVDLSIRTADGVRVIEATGHHPFWSESERQWIDAVELNPGMTLTMDTGEAVPLVATRTYNADQDTYDLTVEGLHTYYVLAGQTPVLVHNSGGLCPKILDETYKSASTPAKLEHVIDPEKHGFADLVARSGGREQAMRRIVDSLGDVSDLPTAGRFEVGRVIDGENVTIRGAVVNGVPRIGTAFNPDKFPGGK
ncbi:polymorphic toxin-type HINT domain-containing protein [Streptomyces sp. WMMC897]|uniref:polymorphic toxin-type HINT domain-containing protein n=1 Tax=Streptomyces sp. WMMC897 TaxID=3014782 RepID=UPI0022B66BE4|nr:polymorphic toxin-type HINT domain-containing protein [Streptomyces sp. WMMC897]MCZ7416925.1 polymorphic toxin-type HINT domain-containing protein [Streptomyces sp. WMMC897]